MFKNHFFTLLMTTLFVVFVWSALFPSQRLIWWLEVAPVLIALPILLFTYKRFQFTRLVYLLILAHAIILLVGGHYTYAEVPLFNLLQQTFDLSRNYYDRLGHFAQGFVPAMIAREILLKQSPLEKGKWLFFIICCMCLSISAFYEFIEWWVAIYEGGAVDAFLGTQGDVWDTQWDMLMALIGSVISQILLGNMHDRQLKTAFK